MKKAQDFNNISDDLRKKFTLKRDDVKIFEVLGISTDAEGKKVIPNMVSIPTRDVIYDEASGQYVDIANLKTGYPNPDGSYNFDKIWFTRRGNGMIALSGKSAKDRELYMYLAMSNYNQSNPDRDVSMKAFYKERDIEAEAKQEITSAMERTEVLDWVFKAKNAQVKLLVKELGLKGFKSVSEMKVAIMGMVTNNYIAVAAKIDKVEDVGDMPDLIDAAVEAKLVKYDGRKHAWIYVGQEGTIKSGVRGANKNDQKIAFAQWLNSEDGKEAAEAMKDMLKK